jgi:hypothetical protein
LSVFGAYSHYYDLLYEEKNYAKEVEFVSAIIRRHAPDAKTMLDLGCGTGRHAWGFTQKGYKVTGLDRSAEMLAKAANQELDGAFMRIRRHLNNGGLVVFDHWYGPAVLTERPAPRIKTFENDEFKITRIATPTLLVNDNLVDVRYDLVVIDKISRRCREIAETHRVRYFFWPEIESLLARHGLERVEFGEWLSGRVPDHSSWNTYVAATGRSQVA